MTGSSLTITTQQRVDFSFPAAEPPTPMDVGLAALRDGCSLEESANLVAFCAAWQRMDQDILYGTKYSRGTASGEMSK